MLLLLTALPGFFDETPSPGSLGQALRDNKLIDQVKLGGGHLSSNIIEDLRVGFSRPGIRIVDLNFRVTRSAELVQNLAKAVEQLRDVDEFCLFAKTTSDATACLLNAVVPTQAKAVLIVNSDLSTSCLHSFKKIVLCDKALGRIFLQKLYLKTKVARGMIRMLPFADSITELTLYGVGLSHRSVFHISRWLLSTFSNESNRSPLLLDLGANKLSGKGSCFIAYIIRQNIRVRGVNLSDNIRIKKFSLRQWIASLALNEHFQALGLLGVLVSSSVLQALDLLCSRPTWLTGVPCSYVTVTLLR